MLQGSLGQRNEVFGNDLSLPKYGRTLLPGVWEALLSRFIFCKIASRELMELDPGLELVPSP